MSYMSTGGDTPTWGRQSWAPKSRKHESGMCNISDLPRSRSDRFPLLVASWLVAGLPSCKPAPVPAGSPPTGPALPLERIAIVGASISAGFGGTPFAEAFLAAAPHAKVGAAASTFLFRHPVGHTKRQLARARAFEPTVIVAIDLLFWDVYGSSDRAWHDTALAAGIAELEAARARGAWIIVGDVPLFTTASELLLPKSAIPDAESLAAANQTIRDFATRERVLLVPLSEWTEPLRPGGQVRLATGETVPAQTVLAPYGLHANPTGVWFLLDRLDHFIETELPGTPKGALVFRKPGA